MSLKTSRFSRFRRGFSLPTIIVVSTVMLTVLTAAVTSSASIRVSLDDQYYQQLASEAAEAGVAAAQSCLAENNYISSWDIGGNGRLLRPNSGCAGATTCTPLAACHVYASSQLRSYFSIPAPVADSSGVQVVTVAAVVELLRQGSTTAWKTYSVSRSVRLGAEVNFNSVVFGYSGQGGAFFITRGADGVLRGVGYNSEGQLGNGTTASTLTPKSMLIPPGVAVRNVMTSFTSGGRSTFVIGSDGNAYGAGRNSWGELGRGSVGGYVTAATVKTILPAAERVAAVSPNYGLTYFVAESGNIYAAGFCGSGQLGSGYVIDGCSNASTPVRVALPAVSASNINTVPADGVVVDGNTALVVMKGGRVYGWGSNKDGQLGPVTTEVATSTPLMVDTYGNAGQPRAIQAITDGNTAFVVRDDGIMTSYGGYSNGVRGTSKLRILLNGLCVDNSGGDGITLRSSYCSTASAPEFAWTHTGQIKNTITGKCVANTTGTTLGFATCSTSATQVFLLEGARARNPSKNQCIQSNGVNTAPTLVTCNSANVAQSISQYMAPADRSSGLDFEIPAIAGKVIKVFTDQWMVSVLTDKGEVWSAGMNSRGELGVGSVTDSVAMPAKFILPAGVTAIDVVSVSHGGVGSDYNNTFVLGSNGRVYGAGSNALGQLGDGTYTDRSTPVAMGVIDGVNVKATALQAGYGTAVVLSSAKRVYTVGNNNSGQLGDGTTTNSATPRAHRYTNVIPSTIY